MTKIQLQCSRYDNYKSDYRSYRSPCRSSSRSPYKDDYRDRYRSRSYSRDNNFLGILLNLDHLQDHKILDTPDPDHTLTTETN